LIGYAVDGFGIYGYCQNSAGTQLKTCWTQTSGTDGTYFTDYYYDSSAYSAGTCHLDKANGYTFTNGTYGYIMTADVPYVPPYFYGTQVTECGL
jgi:hypothetical protein